MSSALSQLRRDLRVAMRGRQEILTPLLFFALVVTLFPIAVSPEPETLAAMAPGVIWVLALLASLLSLESLFRRDHADGSLEQLVLSADPLFLAVAGKLAAHWLASCAPLIVFAPVAALLLALPGEALPTLLLALVLGTPTVTCLGAIGAALTVGSGRGGMLLALIVLPLYVPVLIFATSATAQAANGLDSSAALLWLAVLAAAAATLSPFAVAAALRIACEE